MEQKIMVAFPTTLIIGLGGVGSSIVEKIYRKFDASQPTDIERRNVAFLCMDTDASDIKKRLAVMPSGSVVKTSSDKSCTVGGYIDQIKSKTTVLDWFDTKSPHLLSMSLNEGAGQVRMASRLATIASIDEKKLEAIDGSIKNLLAVDGNEEHRFGRHVRGWSFRALGKDCCACREHKQSCKKCDKASYHFHNLRRSN